MYLIHTERSTSLSSVDECVLEWLYCCEVQNYNANNAMQYLLA